MKYTVKLSHLEISMLLVLIQAQSVELNKSYTESALIERERLQHIKDALLAEIKLEDWNE